MYKSYTQLYNPLVVPIMDYGAVLWGHSEHPLLSMIQKNAMRFFMGCSKTNAYSCFDRRNGVAACAI